MNKLTKFALTCAFYLFLGCIVMAGMRLVDELWGEKEYMLIVCFVSPEHEVKACEEWGKFKDLNVDLSLRKERTKL